MIQLESTSIGLPRREIVSHRRVLLLNEGTPDAAILYTPNPTSRGLFPEWYDPDRPHEYELPDGSVLRARDLQPVSQAEPHDDAEVLERFLGLVSAVGAQKTGPDFAKGRRAKAAYGLARDYGPLLEGLPNELFEPDASGHRHPPNPEPLSEWWEWAKGFDAILDSAARIEAGRLPKAETWALIRAGGRPSSVPRCGRDLAFVLEWLLDVAQFQQGVRYGPKGFDLRVLDPAHTDGPLFAALVRQTLFRIMGIRGLFRCDACGQLHERKRRPKKGQNAYCPQCRKRRVSNRDYAERKRAAALASEKLHAADEVPPDVLAANRLVAKLKRDAKKGKLPAFPLHLRLLESVPEYDFERAVRREARKLAEPEADDAEHVASCAEYLRTLLERRLLEERIDDVEAAVEAWSEFLRRREEKE